MQNTATQTALDFDRDMDDSAPLQDNTAPRIELEEAVATMENAQNEPEEKTSSKQGKGRPRSEKSRKNHRIWTPESTLKIVPYQNVPQSSQSDVPPRLLEHPKSV